MGINVDFVGEWDDRYKNWPTIASYDWVPHEVKLYTSYFCTGYSIKELLGRISLVKAAIDVDYFKIVVRQMTERACHGREGYVLLYPSLTFRWAFYESSMWLLPNFTRTFRFLCRRSRLHVPLLSSIPLLPHSSITSA